MKKRNHTTCYSAVRMAEECGDSLKLETKVQKGVIQSIRFQPFGCGSLRDCASFAAKALRGKKVSEVPKIKVPGILKALKLPPFRTHCAKLVVDTLREVFSKK